MGREEINKNKLLVSAILFKHNVPVEDAKIIGTFIENLEQEINGLKDEIEFYKQQCDDLEMQIGCQE